MSREDARTGIDPRGPALVLLAATSIQFGAALARTLFDEIGPGGTVLLRVAFAAVVLAILWRPAVRSLSRADAELVATFGLALAGMNLCFYESIDRIPLGLAVTFEFVGPLGVAVAGSRRRIDGLWVVLAAGGVVLIAARGSNDLDAVGVLFAVAAGAFWAAYILLGARTGQALPRGDGLALAMCVGAVALVPFGISAGPASLLDLEVVLTGAAVALLSSAIPYSAEFEALRLIPERVFGVLLSVEPALAALAGLLVLDQSLGAHELLGIAFVTAAISGAVAGTRAPSPRDA